jgi:hypothetical protein
MFMLPIIGMAIFVAFFTGLAVAVLIFTKYRARYYVCIWSALALVNGLAGYFFAPRVMLQGLGLFATPGILFGALGLVVWADTRRRPPSN